MEHSGRKARQKKSTPDPRSSSRGVRQIEERLSLILESTTEGYWDWKIKKGEVHYGEGWLATLGYSATDLPKDTSFWESIVHPDDLPEFETHLQSHLRGTTPALDCELRLRAKSGHYRWFRARGKVVQRTRRGIATRMVGTVVDIQSRKVAQDQLARSQAQLEALFESSEDIIWTVDSTDFALLTFNKAFNDLVFETRGFPARPGMHPEELGPPERALLWRTLYAKILQQGSLNCDFELFQKPMALHLTAHHLTRNGQTFGISLFGHDITERKRMEEALRRSEEKFAKAFMQSPMSYTLTSTRDHRYLEVNQAFEEATGYSREEVLGRGPFELGICVHPEHRIELVQGLEKEGYFRNVEVRYRTKSGDIRDALGAAINIEVDGEPCMLSIIADITDRKLAERALQDSEERLRLAVASGRMYAFEWDHGTDIVRRSSESYRILNLGNEHTQHTRHELLDRIHPDDRESYSNAIASSTLETPTYKVAFRFLQKDDTVTWLEESGHGFFDAVGKVQRVVGMVADITELRQTERALRELSGRLITSQEEERRRVARELHDNIGQELALLSVQAQRIDSGISEIEHTAHSDVHEVYKRIKDIALKVSKLSHRLHSSELEFLGLGVAVDRLCRDFGRQYRIDVDHEIKDLPKQIDPTIALCLYRIIQEAFQNVAKHSRATHIVLELMQRNGEIMLRIEDDGKGFTVDLGSFGCGLGLVSMHERMKLIGGSLVINSMLGHGTSLQARVMLPTTLSSSANAFEHEVND
jgi:PAS domain S-box-containing protein